MRAVFPCVWAAKPSNDYGSAYRPSRRGRWADNAAQIFWVEGARKRDGANHFAEHHAAFDGWPAAWPVSDQYHQISASSFAPMRLGSREVFSAGGQGIPWRRLPCSEMPARTAASRWCVNKSRPLSPPFRYVSAVPLTGDLEFNSSPTGAECEAHHTCEKFFASRVNDAS